jgi:hypothetical protein
MDSLSSPAAPGQDELDSVRNEFLRRIGRNIWRYQQVEKQLAFLIFAANVSAPAGADLLAAMQSFLAESQHTFGQRVGDAKERLFSPAPEPDVAFDGRINWSVRFEDSELTRDLLARLEVLRQERNALAHHALDRWSLSDLSSLQRGLLELDGQLERIAAVQHTLRFLRDGTRAMFEELASQGWGSTSR